MGEIPESIKRRARALQRSPKSDVGGVAIGKSETEARSIAVCEYLADYIPLRNGAPSGRVLARWAVHGEEPKKNAGRR